MADSKHTPAFRVELGTANTHCFDDQIIDTKTGYCVAFTDVDTPAGKNIAAAPDLLEALVDALPFVEFAETDDGYKPGAVRTVSTRIRAAIAKAEGRS